jgi:hypothetical protein
MRCGGALAGLAAFFASCCLGAWGGDRRSVLHSLDEALPADGRPALLVFFSTGCTPCFDDLLEMTMFVRRHGLDPAVVGISSDTEAEIDKFIEKHSLTCPVVRDERGRIRRRFKVDLIPFKIIQAGGTEVYRDDYYLALDERLRRAQRCLIELAAGSRSGSPS